jgi:hypothetical protein
MFAAGFTPDATTVFNKKGDLLKLGELVLPADAQLNVNQSQVRWAFQASCSTVSYCVSSICLHPDSSGLHMTRPGIPLPSCCGARLVSQSLTFLPDCGQMPVVDSQVTSIDS